MEHDHWNKFFDFYSDLISNYETDLYRKTKLIIFLGTSLITVTALLVLTLLFNYV